MEGPGVVTPTSAGARNGWVSRRSRRSSRGSRGCARQEGANHKRRTVSPIEIQGRATKAGKMCSRPLTFGLLAAGSRAALPATGAPVKTAGARRAAPPRRPGTRGEPRAEARAMEIFVQQLINGITLGSIYGLIAIGYTMVFGIIGMVNFAHGDVFMVSAFMALITLLVVTSWLGITSIALALVHRAGGRDDAHLAGQLDDRARRLSAAARLVPPRPADLGDRHVDLPDRISCRSRRGRATSRSRRWCRARSC